MFKIKKIQKGINKIAILLLMLTLAFATQAQTTATAFTHATSATLTNTGKDTMYATVVYPFNGYTYAVIQVVITKASGTLAGTSKLYVTLDGTNYDTLYQAPSNSYVWTNYLTLANQTTNIYTWYLTSPYCNVKKFMIVTGGSTTVSATVNAKIIIGKP